MIDKKEYSNYKHIPGYEGLYMISKDGDVISINYHHTGKPHHLKPCINSAGYKKVTLSKNKELKQINIHQLVAITFFGELPNGCEVAHNNGDRLNNHISNLRFASHQDNCRDRIIHGTQAAKETHPMSKLNQCNVNDIRDLLKEGVSGAEIGRRFGVCRSTISQIKRNVIWKN